MGLKAFQLLRLKFWKSKINSLIKEDDEGYKKEEGIKKKRCKKYDT